MFETRRCCQALLLLATAITAEPTLALKLESVQVRGVEGELAKNVISHLSLAQLSPEHRQALTEARLSHLLRAAADEVHEGLEPYGYYNAKVTPETRRVGERVTVIVQVELGEPVRVRRLGIDVRGAAAQDPQVSAQVARFQPKPGELFLHPRYETGKSDVGRVLAERGYFDTDLQTHRVEVSRAELAADIDLIWQSGQRYRFGAASFEGHPFEPGLLEALVPWQPGEPYDQSRLLALQRSLTDTDYFSGVSLQPDLERAMQGQVPIKVTLVPAKRSVYNLGLRYGTDSGAGVNARLERRWLNSRGHKLLLDFNLAQFKSDFTAQYRVPAFDWLDGWLTYSASLREEQIQDITTQYLDVAVNRSGRWRDWTLLAGLNFKRERFNAPDGDYGYSTLLFPSVWANWKDSDDLLTPQHGYGLTLEARGGSAALGSDIDFLQLRAEGRHIRGLGDDNRLLLRAELGTTLSGAFGEFPPSMRFYAGGDRSLRGYGYKEIGESVDGRVSGGKHLAIISAEFEHMFTPVWGGAVFVDAGDAFDTRFDVEIGVGAGVRWRSPVGPVRIDIAHGIGEPEQGVRLHVTIGPDL